MASPKQPETQTKKQSPAPSWRSFTVWINDGGDFVLSLHANAGENYRHSSMGSRQAARAEMMAFFAMLGKPVE